jgi:hypothetical protein
VNRRRAASAIRLRVIWVNTGSVMGTPPSGKNVDVDVIDILRFKDGLAVEHWDIADQVGLMLQIGALPAGRSPQASTPPPSRAPGPDRHARGLATSDWE